MLVIQKSDVKGGILRDIIYQRNDPFLKCLRTYADMLTNSLESLRVLIHHFEGKGLDFLFCLMQLVMSFVLGIMAFIWRDLSQYYLTWPYALIGLAFFT